MRYSLSSSILVFISAALTACAQTELPPGVVAVRDLDYVGAGNPRQQLDLYLPEKAAEKPLPLIVYVHGGGWESGAKSDTSLLFQLIKNGGYAGASVGYRLTQEAAWPAQIHDVKAALRWLSANAGKHGIDPERIGVSGISAGGHLVSLLGTSQGVKEISGSQGGAVADAKIACVMNFCGPANFLTFAGKGSDIDPDQPGSAIAKLLGGPVKQRQEVARAASPVSYISSDDPPFLHIHGTADNLVPYTQAVEFDAALKKAGVSSVLITGKDAPHVFFSVELLDKMQTFFDKHLKGTPGQVKSAEISLP